MLLFVCGMCVCEAFVGYFKENASNPDFEVLAKYDTNHVEDCRQACKQV